MKKTKLAACAQFTGCFICIIIFGRLAFDVHGKRKKPSRSLAVTHLRESSRCFRVKRVRSAFCFPLGGFLNLKHLVINNTHMLESFEVFLGRRTKRNRFLGSLCHVII